MKYLATLLFIGFVATAIFGFVLFDMAPNHSGDCIASAIDGTTCPTNLTDLVTHHALALQILTRIIVPTLFAWLSLLLVLLFISTSLFLFYPNLLPPIRPVHLATSRQKISAWLSLFELSPAW